MLSLTGIFPVMTADAQPAREVVAARPTVEKPLDTRKLTGTVTARRRADLSARTSGLVEAVNVDAGSHVKKGEVLMELDSKLAELRYNQSNEAFKAARVQFEESMRLRDEGNELIRTGGIPETEFRARQSTLKVASAAAKRLQAEAEEQQEVIQRHDLVAPFDGVISEKMAEVGEWVETGDPVLELVEVDDLLLDVQVPQELYGALGEETRILVRLDAYPDQVLPATVEARVPVKDAVARTFLVRLRVEDSDKAMTPGMSAQATLQMEQQRKGLFIPRDALIRNPDGSLLVWVAEERGGKTVASPRPVKVGDSLSQKVEVLEGLNENELVVYRGNESLEDGTPLRLQSNPEPQTGTY